MYKLCKLLKDPILVGIVPVNAFPERSLSLSLKKKITVLSNYSINL